MKIALTGGIACGKSLVSRFLNELGVETIDADDVVHELMPDAAERRRIAAEVFADPAKRKELEARIHPLVKKRISEFLDAGDAGLSSPMHPETPASRLPRTTRPSRHPSSPRPIRLAVIPLLFETHWDAEYDIICCVASSRETQVSRMMAMRGYTREEAEARLAAQLPVAEKAARSHYVVFNNGTAEELKANAKRLVEWLEARSLEV